MKISKIILLFCVMATAALTMQAQTSSKDIISTYNRKMAFSKTAIVPGSENASNFITEYVPGDELYYRVYMDSTISQFINKWRYSNSPVSKFKYFNIQFFIDDKYVAVNTKKLSTIPDEDFKNISTFGSSMHSTPENTDVFSLNTEFKSFMNSQAEKLKGTHKVKIVIYMYDNTYTYEKLATGLLTIKSDQDAMAKLTGISGDYHKSHFKKMVFGSKPVGEEPSESDIITQYTIGQPLYYRIFMDNTIENYRKKYEYSTSYKSIYIKFFVDGTQIKEDMLKDCASLSWKDEEFATITSFGGLIMSDQKVDWDKEKNSIFYVFDNFIVNNDKMLSGTHKLKLEVYLYGQGINKTSELLGDGELTITLDAISKTHPMLCYTPTAVMSDPALEAKLIAAYNEEFAGKATASKAYLMFRDWDVVKNEYTGAILCKVRSANMLVNTESGSCMYAEVSFKMDYEGAGKYGRIQFANLITGGYHPILCECGK